MKQVLQNRSGLTVVRDVPAPPCGPGSVLVRTAYSAISAGTERARVELSQKSLLAKARDRPDLVRDVVARGRREGVRSTRALVSRKLSEETSVGYSCAGFVLEVGARVRGFTPGDRVACAGGGHANHAEIVSVPANLVAAVPAGVPMETAAMTTIAAIALHGIRLAGVSIAESVAVVGCGLVGQIACRLLRAAGARVFAIDVDPMRVEQARAGGADEAFVSGPDTPEAILSTTSGLGVDHVLVTAASTSSDPLVLAAEIARDRGTIILVGDVPIEVPRSHLYNKELSFRVSRSYGPGRYDPEYEERGLDYPVGYVRWTEQRNMEAVLELQAGGRLDLRDLVDVVPVERVSEAYERLLGPSSERPQGTFVLSYGATTDGAPAPRRMMPELPVAHGVATRPAPAPVRVGLIGPGHFAAGVLVPALRAAGAQLELVGGGAGPSAEAAARALGFTTVAESPEAVIADSSVDAVVIATRHGSHAALVEQALEAGKHVFCEKPLALTVQELISVRDAAARSTGILAVGFNRRFAPLLGQLREFVLAPPTPVAATYRISAGSLPAGHWVHDLEDGGGRIVGEVCHFIDSLAFVTGSKVIDVHAAAYGDPNLPAQARDNVAVTLTFASGSVGSILYVADGSPRVPKERLEAFSKARTGILDDYRSLQLIGPGSKEKRRGRTQDKGHRAEVAAFLHAAQRGEAPVSLAEITNVSLATLGVVESLRTGQPIRIATH